MINISALFSNSWKKYSANLGLCIGVFLVGTIISGILSGLTLGIVGIPIIAGLFKSFRKVQQGQAPDFNDLFSEFNNFGKWFMVWVVLVVVIVATYALSFVFSMIPILGAFIVLAIELAVALGIFFLFMLVLDKDLPAFEAVKSSAATVLGSLAKLAIPILAILLFEGVLLSMLGSFVINLFNIVGVLIMAVFLPIGAIIGLVVIFLTGPWMMVARWDLYDAVYGSTKV